MADFSERSGSVLLNSIGGFKPPTSDATAGRPELNKQFGGLSPTYARSLDEELRRAAAMSPMANMMGAGMAMAQAGLLKDSKAIMAGGAEREKFLSQLAGISPAEFVGHMAKQGISADVSSTFINSGAANMEQVNKFGLQNRVRQEQGKEMSGIMKQHLAGGTLPTLKALGMDTQSRRAAAPQIAATMESAIQKLNSADPKLFTDPNRAEERNNKIGAALTKEGVNLPAGAMKGLVASSMRNLEEAMQSDPDLRKYGGIGGALAMHSKDVAGKLPEEAKTPEPPVTKSKLEPGDLRDKKLVEDKITKERARLAGEEDSFGEGRNRPTSKRGPVAAPITSSELIKLQGNLDRLKEQERGGAGGSGAGQGGGGPIKITGTLTIRADGSATLDGEVDSGVPTN